MIKGDFKKRDFEDLNPESHLITHLGPSVVLDYFENPWTLMYFVFKEGLNDYHFRLFEAVMKKANKINKYIISVDENSDVGKFIKDNYEYFLSLKLIIECGKDYEKDIEFTEIYNYSFVDFIANRHGFVYFGVNKRFSQMINKYFIMNDSDDSDGSEKSGIEKKDTKSAKLKRKKDSTEVQINENKADAPKMTGMQKAFRTLKAKK